MHTPHARMQVRTAPHGMGRPGAAWHGVESRVGAGRGIGLSIWPGIGIVGAGKGAGMGIRVGGIGAGRVIGAGIGRVIGAGIGRVIGAGIGTRGPERRDVDLEALVVHAVVVWEAHED